MKRWILGLFLLQLSAVAFSEEYGHYDVVKVISVTGASTPNPQATVNVAYLNQILDDLGSHAGTWPPQFNSVEDRHRAEHDVTALSNMLDTIAENFSHSPPMLPRLAALHGFGHNLDIPGSSQKAEALFIKLLICNDRSNGGELDRFIFVPRSSTKGQRPEQLSSTVDHSDIRGSRPRPRHHNRDSSGAASD